VISVDTSVVVRYLVGTPADQAQRAARLLEGDQDVGISILVLAEAAHVLRSFYRVPLAEIASLLIELVTRTNVTTLEIAKADVLDGLARARAFEAPPLVDVLVASSARALGGVPVATFDRRFGRLGVGVFEP
jgi:predicted nucleic acid-binding protein